MAKAIVIRNWNEIFKVRLWLGFLDLKKTMKIVVKFGYKCKRKEKFKILAGLDDCASHLVCKSCQKNSPGHPDWYVFEVTAIIHIFK